VKERVVRLSSLARTRTIGRKLGQVLQPGDFVGLEGELGAGKTALVRALCLGAGVSPREVASPTFAIMATYPGRRLPILHADLYRLADPDELYATGFFDLLGGEAAAVVEWIDRVPSAAPKEHLLVTIEYAGPTTRTLRARATGARYEQRLTEWLPKDTGRSRPSPRPRRRRW
jgi:tRNA threonylcarbamoyladenosine biosynthesis protein TsaE